MPGVFNITWAQVIRRNNVIVLSQQQYQFHSCNWSVFDSCWKGNTDPVCPFVSFLCRALVCFSVSPICSQQQLQIKDIFREADWFEYVCWKHTSTDRLTWTNNRNICWSQIDFITLKNCIPSRHSVMLLVLEEVLKKKAGKVWYMWQRKRNKVGLSGGESSPAGTVSRKSTSDDKLVFVGALLSNKFNCSYFAVGHWSDSLKCGAQTRVEPGRAGTL